MNIRKKEKGITLIALAVTIIVMLILAGVTIAALTSENGIVNQARKVKEKTKIAKVEEAGQLEYSNLIMEKQMDAVGEEVTINDVKEKMTEEGYEIKEVGENEAEITGIELNESKISIKAGESKEIGITYKYKEGTILKYYVKINEYYHEMKLEEGKIKIEEERVKEPSGSESNKTLQITINPTGKGISAVQEGSKIKVIANANAEGGTKVTIKGTLGSLITSNCEVAVAREIHWVDIADQSYVGYYADLDGDGEPEGIIYADLLKGKKGAEVWEESNGAYTIPTIGSSKSYKVSQEDYEDKLGGTTKMITPSGEGADRFYVMALSNINAKGYGSTWYKNAYGKMNVSDTSSDFGSGETNTTTMIGKWNENKDEDKNGYGLQYERDLWGQIQEEVKNGWFVPSKEEWNVFGGELGITESNYSSKGLNKYYWSSSQYNNGRAYAIRFWGGIKNITNLPVSVTNIAQPEDLYDGFYIRLSTTF